MTKRVFSLRMFFQHFHLLLLLLLSRFSRLWLCGTPWRQPIRLHCPWDFPGKNTGAGCHFLLQCMKVKSENEVAQSCLTLCDPMDCSLPGSSVHGIFQARVLEWGAIAFWYPIDHKGKERKKRAFTFTHPKSHDLSQLPVTWPLPHHMPLLLECASHASQITSRWTRHFSTQSQSVVLLSLSLNLCWQASYLYFPIYCSLNCSHPHWMQLLPWRWDKRAKGKGGKRRKEYDQRKRERERKMKVEKWVVPIPKHKESHQK